MRYFSLVLLSLLVTNIEAREMPDMGPTFVIIEEDLEMMIQKKLHNPEIQAKIKEVNTIFQKQTIGKTTRPTPVAGISKTKVFRKFKFDPSTSIPHDLTDHKGEIFYKANTNINPLEHVQLPSPLVFIDGDDEEQINWLLELKQQKHIEPTVILVQGEPFKMAAKIKQEVFFDQGGFITSHFTISHVPATVKQEKDHLLVEEIAI